MTKEAKHLLRPEYPLALFQEEIEILLEDIHVRIANLLQYLDQIDRVAKDAVPAQSIRRRVAVLRNLAAKLELSLTQKETNERQTTNRNRGDHSAESCRVSETE